MGANKSIEELKKELSNMHKQFDSLFVDKDKNKGSKISKTKLNLDEENIEKKKTNFVIDKEKTSLDDSLDFTIIDNDDDFLLEKKVQNLKEEIQKEVILSSSNEKPIEKNESQKKDIRYLSIKEKLDLIKKEIEVSSKKTSSNLNIESFNETKQQKTDEELKAKESKTSLNIAKESKTSLNINDTKNIVTKTDNNPKKKTNKKKKYPVLNIIIIILIILIITLIYFIF